MTKPLKIFLLGDPGTGKTNLLSRLSKNQFNPKYEPTTGMNEVTHDIHVEADIWDFAGREKYRHLADPFLCDADGVLLVYDVSNPATFENLAVWVKHIRQVASPKMIIKLVGNKNDLQNKVSRKEVEQFATDKNLSSIETSALNDTNVQLAFESIAQEIDVARHSVSEPSVSSPDPLVEKSSKASSDDDQQEKPFQVVLIDIGQAAATSAKIVCVEKPLDEANLEFIAISYRWGEVDEQVIDTNLGYVASVTSFALNHFYQLCRDIMDEPELQSIKYVWVDAICVDQNNHARRKATIYQMSNIYHRAAYILAVPDLHLDYLWRNQIFDEELRYAVHKVKGFNEFIYYLLQEKTDQLVQITEKWFDEMNIPKAMARKKLTSDSPNGLFEDYLGVYNEQDVDSPCPSPCKHNWCNTYGLDCHDIPNAMLDLIQYSINECHFHSENTTMVCENSDCALCSLQMDMCQHQKETLNKNESIPDSDQKWLACVVREFRYDKYRRLVDDRANTIAKFMEYLRCLVKDWSSRVWVISEYKIAKAKHSSKLKFWFLSLRLTVKDDIKNMGFFVFDFDKMNANVSIPGNHYSLNRVISKAGESYRDFQKTLVSQINEQSFVEMMLDSKASRNEDRFYAIFPSSEYKDMITSREIVSSWQIDTITSVKLKLYELMTTKDKLDLLYWTGFSFSELSCTFPAFANINMNKIRIPSIKERNEKNDPCNFDLGSKATLRLVPPMEDGFQFHKLNLSPKMYYVFRPGRDKYTKHVFVDDKPRFWETLEINPVDDDLVLVKIPMYMYCNSMEIYPPTYIVLFGNFEKNKWLLCRTLDACPIIKELQFKDYDNSDGNISFDIY